jgi:glycosyltransferase involved in cell wall biosynthesis
MREVGFGSWTKKAVVASCALRSDFLRRYENEELDSERKQGSFRILTLARIHPRKGQWDVAKALARLPEKWRSQVVYQIAGKGDPSYLKQVVKECESHGVQVEVLGEIPEDQMGVVYQGCDLYVMASHSLPESVEGFGMTYLEAGFFQKPVVGYRTGGVAEAVLDGKTVLLVGEGEVEALTEAILKVLENPTLARDMGVAGRNHSLSFSWKKTAQTLFA